MKAKAKKAADTPPAIKAFVDRVLSTPEDQLADVLEAFVWKADKGDFHHWVSLFNFFDAYLETHVQNRADLQLKCESDQTLSPLPSRNLKAILKATAQILENCSNKHLYSSCEHLETLLGAPDQEVVTATLVTLVALVRKTHIASIRFPGSQEQNARLLALAQGWGGKEQGLGMVECAHMDEAAVREGVPLATHLHFEFYSEANADSGESPGLQVINVPRLDQHPGTDHEIFCQLVMQYKVPEAIRFSLLSKIRVAHNFGNLQGRRHLVQTRLFAFYVWFQSNPGHEDIASFFQREGEFVSELVALLQAETAVPETLRILALRALAVQLLDRTRHTPVVSAISTGGQTGLLSMLMHKAVRSITSGAASSDTKPQYSMQFVEALLSLLGALVACSSGCTALSDAGVVPALLPLVRDTDSEHVNLVSAGVRILEAFMDFNQAAASVFRDLGGLQAMINRLELDIAQRPAHISTEEQVQAAKTTGTVVSSDSVLVPYARRVLLKSLLRAVALASYHHGSNNTRVTEEEQSKLFKCLKMILEHGQQFGGALFALASSVMSDLIHHDPLCFKTLDEAGLPEAYLKAVQAGILPSSEAVCSLPNTLVAICLNNAGLERVQSTKALACIVQIFTSKTYTKALQGDTPPALGAGLDELLRHVSSLRKEGVDMMISILRRLCEMGGLPLPPADDPMETDAPQPGATADAAAAPADAGQDTEMASDEPTSSVAAAAASTNQPAAAQKPEDADVASYLPECITHTARLLESVFSNHDTCSKFVQQGGIEALLHLYKLPRLPPTFGSSSASHSLLAMFRALTAHNSADIATKLQPALASHFMLTLETSKGIGSKSVPELPAEERDTYIRQVSSTVGLAALAATVVRVAPGLLLSLCSPGSDKSDPILAELGKLERHILLQLAVAETWKRSHDASKGTPAPEAEPSSGALSTDGVNASPVRDVAMASTAPADAELLDDADTEATAGSADRENAAGNNGKGRKKTPEELSVEVLLHFVGTVRAFYSSVAKAVHAQARRRDDPSFQPNASMHAASVTVGIILRHNLLASAQVSDDDKGKGVGPLVDQSKPEGMRYMQRIVDEIIAVLFDSRRQSCHGLVLNRFIAFSGFKQLLVAFQHACHTLFTIVTEAETQPAAPSAEAISGADVPGAAIATADTSVATSKPAASDSPKQAAEKLVWSFLVLFENLVSARTLLKSLQEASLLVSPLPGQPAMMKGQEVTAAEAFVKKLQATVVKAVLPLWSHPQLSKCSFRITRHVITILTDCSAGTSSASAVLNRASTVIRPNAAPDPAMVQNIVDMGFSRARVEETLRRINYSSAELAVEWLMAHPEDPAAASSTAADATAKDADEDAIKKQVMDVLGPDETPPERLEAMLDESAEAPGIEQLVNGAVSTVAQTPAAAFPLSDMLVSLCTQESSKNKQQVFESLVQHLKGFGPAAVAVQQQKPEALLAPVHLLAILLTEDKGRGSATAFVHTAQTAEGRPWQEQCLVTAGLFDIALSLLEAWVQQHASAQPASRSVTFPEEIPRWVDALLLCLDMGMQPQPAGQPPPQVEQPQAPSVAATGAAAASTPAPAANPAAAGTSIAAPTAAPTAASAEIPTPAAAVSTDGAVPVGAATPAAAVSSSKAEASDTNEQTPAVQKKTTEERQRTATQLLRDSIRTMFMSNGLLSQQQLEHAASICMKLLHHLHAWGSVWTVPDSDLSDKEAFARPEPAASTQAVLQVLARVTKSHKVAVKVLAGGGPRLILDLPGACFLPEHEPYVSAIFRHILEDPVTLQAAMEAEIRNTLAARGSQANAAEGAGSTAMPVRQFLSTISPVIAREPSVFVEAFTSTCSVEEASGALGSGRPIILLKPKVEDKANAQKDKPAATTGDAAPQPNAAAAAAATPGPPPTGAATPRPASTLSRQGSGRAGGTPKGKDTPRTSGKTAAKGSKKVVPASFVEVIDCLVDVCLQYKGVQPGEEADLADPEASKDSAPFFEVSAQLPDGRMVTVHSSQPGRGPGQTPAGAAASQGAGQAGQTKPKAKTSFTEQAMNPKRREVLIQCLALKMLTDFTLMYSSCVGVLLKRDGEIASKESGLKTPAKGTHPAGGLFKHVMHANLTHLSEPSSALQGMTEQAAFFLLSTCIRSAEGRRRIVHEIVYTLNASDKADAVKETQNIRPPISNPYRAQPGFAAPHKVKAFVELVASLLSASISNPNSQEGPTPPGLAGEMLRVMKEAGVLKGLTNALKLVDTSHPQAAKSITAILKPLEILTRPTVPRARPAAGGQAPQAGTAPGQAAASQQGGATAGGSSAGPQSINAQRNPTAEGTAGGDAHMEEAEESAAGPEAMAAAEAAREAGRRARNQGRRNFGARSMEALVEDMIEQAYAGDGLEGFNSSDSENDHSGDDDEDDGEGMSGDEEMGEQEDFEGSFDEDDHDEDSEGDNDEDDDDDENDDDLDDDDDDEGMSDEDSEVFSDEGSEDAEAVDVILDQDDEDIDENAGGAVVINMGGPGHEDGMIQPGNDEIDEDEEEEEEEEEEDEEDEEAYDEDESEMAGQMEGDEEADWEMDLLNDEDENERWDAVGELLGNMAGPGARLINPDRRRARIMQSRGARVLGDGPPSASTHAVGPSAPSTQHRLLQRPAALYTAAGQAGLAAGRADAHAAGAMLEQMPMGLRRIAGQAAQILSSHPGLPFPEDLRHLFGDLSGLSGRAAGFGRPAAGFTMGTELAQAHAQAGTRAGGWAEGVGSSATAVNSLAGALERQLQDVLHEPEAPAAPGPAAQPAAEAGQQGQPAAAAAAPAQGAGQQPPARNADPAYRGDELQQREEALRAQLEELTSIQTRAVQALQDASAAASSAPAAASSGQAAAPAAAAANPVTQSAAAAAPPAQPEAQAGPSTAGNATTAGSGVRSPPQPALFRTPAAPPTGDAARGMAQVLEGGARTGRITSAMFGSAIQAALAAATQGAAQPSSAPAQAQPDATAASGGDQNMADADEEEPAPPADLDIAAPAADTAMDEEAEPAAPMGVPMATTESEAVAMDADAQPGSGLDEQLVQAAQAAGIDLAFLEALPEELRSEVLAAHGVSLPPPPPPQPPAPVPAATPAAAAATTSQPQPSGSAAAPQAAEVQPAGDAAPAAGTSGEAAAQQAAAPEEEGDSIDPEFLAALPPEIQAEVLEQQRRERRIRERQRQHQQQAAAAAAQGQAGGTAAAALGAAGEMDLATILATFPPDVREEVLLTSEEDVINSLPPALLAEAQQLRQRVMQHYRENNAGGGGGRGVVFVGPNSTAYARQTARRPGGAPGQPPVGWPYSSGHSGPSGSALAEKEPEGPPQVEEEALLLLTGLLKLSEAPARTQLQKVLLNLCAHSQTRKSVMQILMGMLRAPLSADEVPEASQKDVQMEETEACTSQALVPSPVRPGQEMPPQISRRVLEYANHLARHKAEVARDLLRLHVPTPEQLARRALALQDKKGKGRHTDWAAEVEQEQRALEVLIGMTAKTLCRRSNAHLEQALLLVEVTLGHSNLHWKMLVEQHLSRQAAALAAAAAEAQKAVKEVEEAQKAVKEAEEAKKKAEGQQDTQMQASTDAEAQQAPELAAPAAAGSGQQGPASGSAQQEAPSTIAQQASTTQARQAAPSSTAAAENASTASTSAGAATDSAGAATANTANPGTGAGPATGSPGASGQGKGVEVPELNQADNPEPVIQSLPEQLLKHLPRLLGQSGLSDLAQKRCATIIKNMVDMCPKLKPLMLSELQDELQRLAELAGQELKALQANDFSSTVDISAHASGVRILVLRVLKAAVSLIKAKGKSQDPTMEQSEEQDTAVTAQMGKRLEPLWTALSAAISQIEAKLPANTAPSSELPSAASSILPPGAAQVLPLIEAYFVMCDAQTVPQQPPQSVLQSATSSEMAGPSSMEAPTPQRVLSAQQHTHGGATPPSQPVPESQVPFLRFADKHRRLLNTLLRSNASLLQGSLLPLLKVPRLIEFDNKRAYFRTRIHATGDNHRRYGGLRIAVRRSHVFEDSFHQMRMRSPEEMRMKLSVQFQGEEGIDAGGVSREWYQVMAREIFNPNFSLFVQVPEHGTTFQPNANSVVQNDEARGTNHLDFFKFVGRILGKALYDGQLIDAFFTRSFYKHMLGDPLTYEDIEAVDPEYYKNLIWMLENDITDVLDLTFSEESDYFGKKELIDLKPGGNNIKVTEENKREYVNLIARHRMTTAIKPQINAFLTGFWDLVPKDLINMFNDHELELLISGLPEIDVDDLRGNTEYTGYTPAAKQIQWFWQVVSELSKEDLALLVQFVTGTSKVPLEGFKALQGISGPQKFQIHKSYGPQERLPSAHTCFNQLDILEYESKEQLKDRLMVAIHEGSEGFGFG